MNRFSEFIKKTGKRLKSSIQRFPEALLFAAAAVVLGIWLNHWGEYFDSATRDMFGRIIMTLALGIPLFLSLKVLFERFGISAIIPRAVWSVISLGGLAAYYFLLLKDFNMVPVVRYIAFTLALYVIFAFIPYFYSREKYELYVIKLFTSFIITYVYSIILYLGLAAIVFTIDKLFTAHVSSKLYLDMFLVVAGIFAPGYFLSGIPGREDPLHLENYPKVLRVLLLSIVMPLTAAYAAILYAYFIKILVTWNWPAGIVSNLVLWFSIICSIVIFMIYLLKEGNKWASLYVRWTPILILPLLLMMFTSIGIRLSAYGVTERRYYVVLGGLWVTGYMIYLIIRREPRNIVLPASLALIAVLSVAGPWSSFSVSKFSQNLRFETVLKNNGMLQNNSIGKAPSNISEKDKTEISEIISYFSVNHSIKDVRYLPAEFRIGESEKLFGFKVSEIGPRYANEQEYFNHVLSEDSHLVDIRGYDFLLQFPNYKQTSLKESQFNLEFSNSNDNKQLTVTRNGKVIYSGKPAAMAEKIHETNKGREMLDTKAMSISDENANIKILYVFRNINGSTDKATGLTTINPPEYYLLVKLK